MEMLSGAKMGSHFAAVSVALLGDAGMRRVFRRGFVTPAQGRS